MGKARPVTGGELLERAYRALREIERFGVEQGHGYPRRAARSGLADALMTLMSRRDRHVAPFTSSPPEAQNNAFRHRLMSYLCDRDLHIIHHNVGGDYLNVAMCTLLSASDEAQVRLLIQDLKSAPFINRTNYISSLFMAACALTSPMHPLSAYVHEREAEVIVDQLGLTLGELFANGETTPEKCAGDLLRGDLRGAWRAITALQTLAESAKVKDESSGADAFYKKLCSWFIIGVYEFVTDSVTDMTRAKLGDTDAGIKAQNSETRVRRAAVSLLLGANILTLQDYKRVLKGSDWILRHYFAPKTEEQDPPRAPSDKSDDELLRPLDILARIVAGLRDLQEELSSKPNLGLKYLAEAKAKAKIEE